MDYYKELSRPDILYPLLAVGLVTFVYAFIKIIDSMKQRSLVDFLYPPFAITFVTVAVVIMSFIVIELFGKVGYIIIAVVFPPIIFKLVKIMTSENKTG